MGRGLKGYEKRKGKRCWTTVNLRGERFERVRLGL